MADPRYADIGLAPDYAAQAAESFYSSVPELSFGGGYAQPQFQDQYDIEAAYEKNLASEIQAIDPSDPEYEAKIVDWSVSKEDPDAINYPRVKAAIRAGATRAKLYRDQITSRQESNQKLGMQLAEAGVPPDKLVDYQDANGNYDPYKVAYASGQIKLGRASDKTDPNSLSETAIRDLHDKISEIGTIDPTDEEKIEIFGRKPSNDAEWSQADSMVRESRMAPVRQQVELYRRFGKTIPSAIDEMLGISTSQVQSTPESQAPTTPNRVVATPKGTTPDNPKIAFDPTQPFSRINAGLQESQNQSRRNAMELGMRGQREREANAPAWEHAKQQVLSVLTTEDISPRPPVPGSMVYGPTTGPLPDAARPIAGRMSVNKDDIAFVDQQGRKITWGDVITETLADPRIQRPQENAAVGESTVTPQ